MIQPAYLCRPASSSLESIILFTTIDDSIPDFDHRIDHLVYQLYNLTDEEITIVESSN